MATTDPLTGATIQDQSDGATGGTQIGNAVKGLRSFTVPRFASTTTRDTAYSAFVSGGGAMADGMMCTAAGVPYRRIAGTWRIDRNRVIVRTLVLTGGAGTITSGGSNETGITTGVNLAGGSTFVVYETSTYAILASLRANPTGGTGAAVCTVKIDGTAQGNFAVSRADGTVPVNAAVTLAPGTHTISLRVDAQGTTVTWIDGVVVLTEGTAE